MSSISRSALLMALKITTIYACGWLLCRLFLVRLPAGLQVIAAGAYFGAAMVWVFQITKHQLAQTSALRSELQAAAESFENRLRSRTSELEEALKNNTAFQGIIPICANCKSIRNGDGDWERIESYVQRHTDAVFTHGLCPGCNEALYGEERRRFKKHPKAKVAENA